MSPMMPSKNASIIAGTHSDPLVGEHIGASVARVDGHHMATVFANFLEFLDLDRAHRLIAARIEQHDVFGVGRIKHRRRTQKGLIRSIDVGIGKQRNRHSSSANRRSQDRFAYQRIGCASILERATLLPAPVMWLAISERASSQLTFVKPPLPSGFHGLGHAIFGSRERRQALATATHISARMQDGLRRP